MTMRTLATPEFREYCHTKMADLFPQAAGIVAEGEQHLPLLILFSHENEIAYMPLQQNSSSDKDTNFALQRALAHSDIVACTVSINEAWVASVDKDHEFEGSLEHVPGRTEAIIYSFIKGDEQLICMCPINRADNSLKRGELVDPHAFETEGRMIM